MRPIPATNFNPRLPRVSSWEKTRYRGNVGENFLEESPLSGDSGVDSKLAARQADDAIPTFMLGLVKPGVRIAQYGRRP